MKTLEKINIWSFTVKLIEIEERPHQSKYYIIESIEKPNKAKISFWIAWDIITAFEKYIEACKAIIEKNYYNEINYYYK